MVPVLFFGSPRILFLLLPKTSDRRSFARYSERTARVAIVRVRRSAYCPPTVGMRDEPTTLPTKAVRAVETVGAAAVSAIPKG